MAGFLWRFALIYGLLIMPWPGFNAVYGRYFRALAQMAFPREDGRRILHFEAVPEASRHRLDTRIALANRDRLDRYGTGPMEYLELDTRGVGWVPTALILALVLVTPIPWRRRSLALLWGLLAVHGFILLSLAAYIWNRSAELALVAPTPFWKQVTDGLEETLITQMGASFVVPVLIWIFVTLRRQEVLAWQSTGEMRPSRQNRINAVTGSKVQASVNGEQGSA